MERSGFADLPLHGGRVPSWLAERMQRLGAAITECVIHENLGPRTLQTLALVAEVIHGAHSRFSDPARFSFALGGKDGHPFPVPLKTYDESLSILRRSLNQAKLGRTDKLDGFKRLDALTRRVEQTRRPEADFDELVKHEHAISPALDGRTVSHWPPSKGGRRPSQLSLFSNA